MSNLSIRGKSEYLGAPVSIELEGDRLRLRHRFRETTLSLRHAQLGVAAWVMRGSWTSIGIALVVQAGGREICIGIRGLSRPPEGRSLPARAQVDVVVEPSDGEALSEAIQSRVRATGRNHAASTTRVFELYPNGTSILGALRTMLPWLRTILFLSLVLPLVGTLIGHTRLGTFALAVLTAASVVHGLASTVRASRAPVTPHRLEAHPARWVLRDPAGVLVFDLPRERVSPKKGVYEIPSRGRPYLLPSIAFAGTDGKLWTFGAGDPGLVWKDAAPKTKAPPLLVCTMDWEALLEALGLDENTVPIRMVSLV